MTQQSDSPETELEDDEEDLTEQWVEGDLEDHETDPPEADLEDEKSLETLSADTCRDVVETEPMRLAVLVQQVRDITHYYRDTGGSFPERMNARNKRVRELFAKLREERRVAHAAHVRSCELKKSCSSSVGRSKLCKAILEFPASYVIFKTEWRGKPQSVKLKPDRRRISVKLKKSGKGSKRAWVRGTARYTDEHVDSLVALDIEQLRRVLVEERLPTDTTPDVPPDAVEPPSS